jgi:hypothetical protein
MSEKNIKTMENKSLIYETSDIALAAYLKLKGLVLLKCERDKKFCFVFDDPENKAEELAIEFINSDMRRYDDEIRSLKKIIFNK